MKKLIAIIAILTALGCKTAKDVNKEIIKNDSIIYVDRLKVDTIQLFEKIETLNPTENEINLKCDSTSFKQSFKNGSIKYKIIKQKGDVRLIFRTDTITNSVKKSYYSRLSKKDSLQKVVKSKDKLIISKQQPSFLQIIYNNIWKVLFWTIFVLWVLGITPSFFFGLLMKKLNP
ncbi:MAG: hypothetical protein ACEQSF_06065 [Solirubrobacteraceae bacterium]